MNKQFNPNDYVRLITCPEKVFRVINQKRYLVELEPQDEDCEGGYEPRVEFIDATLLTHC